MTRISLVLSIALAVLAGRTTFAGEPQTRPSDTPVTIIFDTDLGNDVDDAMAMDMLYKYIDAGKANVIGIMTNRTMPSGRHDFGWCDRRRESQICREGVPTEGCGRQTDVPPFAQVVLQTASFA